MHTHKHLTAQTLPELLSRWESVLVAFICPCGKRMAFFYLTRALIFYTQVFIWLWEYPC